MIDSIKVSGKLAIINDTMIRLNNREVIIDKIDKLRIGHLGLNISLAGLSGLISASSFTGAIALFIYSASEKIVANSVVTIIIGIPLVAIAIPTLLLTLKFIQNCKWNQLKEYDISVIHG